MLKNKIKKLIKRRWCDHWNKSTGSHYFFTLWSNWYWTTYRHIYFIFNTRYIVIYIFHS